MKIVSWNCNGKFREKVEAISTLSADIYIIQECENPKESNDPIYAQLLTNCIWTGTSQHKGLGIFASRGITLVENKWEKYCLRCFISAKVNDSFDIVGVWACKPYIEEYYLYQTVNIAYIDKTTVIMGDFNSNGIWNKEHGTRNHSAVVKELESIGLHSAYHWQTNEVQGKETIPTFYMYRNTSKPYHIDHCFVSKERIKAYSVCSNPNFWLKYSDHIPIVLEI